MVMQRIGELHNERTVVVLAATSYHVVLRINTVNFTISGRGGCACTSEDCSVCE